LVSFDQDVVGVLFSRVLYYSLPCVLSTKVWIWPILKALLAGNMSFELWTVGIWFQVVPWPPEAACCYPFGVIGATERSLRQSREDKAFNAKKTNPKLAQQKI
jgi:hypothetical protein